MVILQKSGAGTLFQIVILQLAEKSNLYMVSVKGINCWQPTLPSCRWLVSKKGH